MVEVVVMVTVVVVQKAKIWKGTNEVRGDIGRGKSPVYDLERKGGMF